MSGVNVEIRGSETVSQAAESARRGLGNLTNETRTSEQAFKSASIAAAAVAAAVAVMARAVGDCVTEFAEIEKATVTWNAAMKQTGLITDDGARSLRNLAEEMSRVTGVDDELILSMQSLLATSGRTQEGIEAITRAAADLSVVTGKDLQTSVEEINKTFSGTSGRLGQLIPELKDLSEEELINGKAVDVIAEKYRGLSEQLADTADVKIKNLKNAWDDLKGAFGEFTMPAIAPVVDFFTTLIKGWTDAYNAQKNYTVLTGSQDTLKKIVAANQELETKAAAIRKQKEVIQNLYPVTNAQLENKNIDDRTLPPAVVMEIKRLQAMISQSDLIKISINDWKRVIQKIGIPDAEFKAIALAASSGYGAGGTEGKDKKDKDIKYAAEALYDSWARSYSAGARLYAEIEAAKEEKKGLDKFAPSPGMMANFVMDYQLWKLTGGTGKLEEEIIPNEFVLGQELADSVDAFNADRQFWWGLLDTITGNGTDENNDADWWDFANKPKPGVWGPSLANEDTSFLGPLFEWAMDEIQTNKMQKEAYPDFVLGQELAASVDSFNAERQFWWDLADTITGNGTDENNDADWWNFAIENEKEKARVWNEELAQAAKEAKSIAQYGLPSLVDFLGNAFNPEIGNREFYDHTWGPSLANEDTTMLGGLFEEVMKTIAKNELEKQMETESGLFFEFGQELIDGVDAFNADRQFWWGLLDTITGNGTDENNDADWWDFASKQRTGVWGPSLANEDTTMLGGLFDEVMKNLETLDIETRIYREGIASFVLGQELTNSVDSFNAERQFWWDLADTITGNGTDENNDADWWNLSLELEKEKARVWLEELQAISREAKIIASRSFPATTDFLGNAINPEIGTRSYFDPSWGPSLANEDTTTLGGLFDEVMRTIAQNDFQKELERQGIPTFVLGQELVDSVDAFNADRQFWWDLMATISGNGTDENNDADWWDFLRSKKTGVWGPSLANEDTTTLGGLFEEVMRTIAQNDLEKQMATDGGLFFSFGQELVDSVDTFNAERQFWWDLADTITGNGTDENNDSDWFAFATNKEKEENRKWIEDLNKIAVEAKIIAARSMPPTVDFLGNAINPEMGDRAFFDPSWGPSLANEDTTYVENLYRGMLESGAVGILAGVNDVVENSDEERARRDKELYAGMNYRGIIAGAPTIPTSLYDDLSLLGDAFAELRREMPYANYGYFDPYAQSRQSKETFALEKVPNNAKSGFETILEGLGLFNTGLMDAFMSLDSVIKIVDYGGTIIAGIMDIVGPMVDKLLGPLVGILTIVGQTIGQILMPMLQGIAPVINFVVKVFIWLYNSLLPVINGVIGLSSFIWNAYAKFFNFLKNLSILGWRPFDDGSPDIETYDGWKPGELKPITAEDLNTGNGTTSGGGTGATYTKPRDLTVNVAITTSALVGENGITEFALIVGRELRSSGLLNVS